MELKSEDKKNFYRLVFTNGQEFFIESENKKTETFLKELTNSGLLSLGSDYISIQRVDVDSNDPLNLVKAHLFSVQKVNASPIGAQTKLWRLL